MLLGGRAAEMEILGTMTAGASDDIQRASTIAWKMVAELGMSHLGPICVGDGHRREPGAARPVDETARALDDSAASRAIEIVRSRRGEIEALVKALLEKRDARHWTRSTPASRPIAGRAPKARPPDRRRLEDAGEVLSRRPRRQAASLAASASGALSAAGLDPTLPAAQPSPLVSDASDAPARVAGV